MVEFKENTRYWYTYGDVHKHAGILYKNIQTLEKGASNLIAIGRGGWLPTRVLATYYEENNIPFSCYSVGATYVNLGNPDEHVEMTQGLDVIAINSLIENTNAGYHNWVIDGPYLAGRTMLFVKNYITEMLKRNNINKTVKIGVLHWVQFDSCPEAPWRKQSLIAPDAYGERIYSKLKPYVEYPWEYGDIGDFGQKSS